MNRTEAIFLLQKIEDAFRTVQPGCDEAEALAMGIYALGTIEELRKERDAAMVERTGRWFDRGSLSCRCDQCGCKSTKESPYCPNCGAKMENES